LSILILCKDELESLRSSLKTWEQGGVLAYANEVLVYFQGRNAHKEAFIKPYIDKGLVTRVIGDGRLFPIGAAVNWLVGNATNDKVLFLEKDFALIEPAEYVAPRLDDGIQMLDTGEADVVRYRSRWNSGEPNFAQGMFQGREHVILMRQPNLYCSVHYWLKDEVLLQKPHSRYIWPCPRTKGYFCTKSKLCNWTNNPQMFKREWFLSRWVAAFGRGLEYFCLILGWLPVLLVRNPRLEPYRIVSMLAVSRYRSMIDEMIKQPYPQSDLEYVMNWRYEVWNDADITVAMGEGLFTHREIGEHGAIDFTSMRVVSESLQHGVFWRCCGVSYSVARLF
jgi:hypothetical protein